MIYTVRITGFRPFYVTENPILAVRMTRMLLREGYKRATLMKEGSLLPVWEENFEQEIAENYLIQQKEFVKKDFEKVNPFKEFVRQIFQI